MRVSRVNDLTCTLHLYPAPQMVSVKDSLPKVGKIVRVLRDGSMVKARHTGYSTWYTLLDNKIINVSYWEEVPDDVLRCR